MSRSPVTLVYNTTYTVWEVQGIDQKYTFSVPSSLDISEVGLVLAEQECGYKCISS